MCEILAEINTLPKGTFFKLNYLLSFKVMHKGKKIALGREFSNQVKSGLISTVVFLGKDAYHHHAVYVKL